MRAPLPSVSLLHVAKDSGLGFSAQAADQGVVTADAIFGGMYRDGQVFRPLSACVASRIPRSMRRWSIQQYRVHRRA
jgi:hypothetical protein